MGNISSLPFFYSPGAPPPVWWRPPRHSLAIITGAEAPSCDPTLNSKTSDSLSLAVCFSPERRAVTSVTVLVVAPSPKCRHICVCCYPCIEIMLVSWPKKAEGGVLRNSTLIRPFTETVIVYPKYRKI